MSRYIDADALIEKKWQAESEACFYALEDVVSVTDIEEAPSIDIVRCKECRHCLVGVATAQYSNGKQRIENLCEKHKWSVRADDYCSYGERKE